MSSKSSNPADTPVSPTRTMHRRHRQVSLRRSLALLVLACIFPALCVSGFFAWQNYQLEKQLIYGQAEVLARQIASQLDRELAAVESGLHVLATSESLRKGDLRRFHQLASDAVRSQIVYNYILTDRDGRQVLNTLKPFGAPLPTSGTPAQLQAVFQTADTVLTDYFVGPVTGKPAIAMGVPVFDAENRVIYSLNIGLSPERLNRLLSDQSLPPGWLVAIIDSSGTIVSRSRDAENFVGQKAVPPLRAHIANHAAGTLETYTKEGIRVATATARLATFPWSVATGAPKSHLEGEMYRNFALVSGAALLLVALGSWLAFRLAHRVIASVRELNSAALALREGKPLSRPGVEIEEAEAVGHAIAQASQLMAEVHHRAYHDPLTDLANRNLFYELVQHRLAESARDATELAVLAIDLDKFKIVNDEAGHAAGDALLKTVAERISSAIRAADVAARMGGDEFSVLLVDIDETGAVEIVRRLVRVLAQPYPDITVAVSASIGVAIAPRDGDTLASLLEAADQALYAAKHAGRNTFRLARPDAAPGPLSD